MRNTLLAEFVIVFVILPAALALRPLPWWPLPLLWLLSLYCFAVLRRQPDFRRESFWGAGRVASAARAILTLFLPLAGLVASAVYALAPHLFLEMPLRNPVLWGAVMLLYPIFSVVPQTVIYRAFIFHRYRDLFPKPWVMIAVSGIAFAWLHVVLRNPLAPALTLPGGLLFAWRYARSQSVLVSAFEHALYGCLMFTIGLGAYFVSGGSA